MRFLSQCIGLPVRDPSGEPIGTIADLIVAIGGKYPPVTTRAANRAARRRPQTLTPGQLDALEHALDVLEHLDPEATR